MFEEWQIYYMACRCNIWPLVIGGRVGRCGNCGVRPFKQCTKEEWENQTPLQMNFEEPNE